MSLFLGGPEVFQEGFRGGLSSYEIITSLVHVEEDSAERVSDFPPHCSLGLAGCSQSCNEGVYLQVLNGN